MHTRARVVAKRVKLFGQRESIAETGGGWMAGIFDQDRRGLRPRMLLEVRAHQPAVVGPFVQRVGGAVHAKEPFAARHEVHNRGFLGRTELQLAGRQCEEDDVVTREQAIRFYTINNAQINFEEREKGSLERGKYADLILVDRDILKCPASTLISSKEMDFSFLIRR